MDLLDEKMLISDGYSDFKNCSQNTMLHKTWVKVFSIIPEFRILRPTSYRKSASKY